MPSHLVISVRSFFPCFAFFVVFANHVEVQASVSTMSLILRDNRVRDKAITPSLGRGYSLSTNTYQSNCMGSVKKTTPSFDFDYEFTFVSDSKMDSSKSAHKGSASGGYNGFFNRVHVAVSADVVQSGKKTKDVETVGVRIMMYSYYSSVDEGMGGNESCLLYTSPSPRD